MVWDDDPFWVPKQRGVLLEVVAFQRWNTRFDDGEACSPIRFLLFVVFISGCRCRSSKDMAVSVMEELERCGGGDERGGELRKRDDGRIGYMEVRIQGQTSEGRTTGGGLARRERRRAQAQPCVSPSDVAGNGASGQ